MRIEKVSIIEEIVSILNKKIFVSKEYQPNCKLPNERELAEELNVSRNSLREAIKKLEAKGILVIKRGMGTYVAPDPGQSNPFEFLKIQDREKLLWNLFEVRLIFEPGVVRLATERASSEEIEEIELSHQYGVQLVKNGEDFSPADKKFHLAIAKAAHNEAIERFIPSIHESISEFHAIYPSSSNENWKSMWQKNFLESHEDIVRFIKLRDPVGAEISMRYHMQRTISDLREIKNKLEK